MTINPSKDVKTNELLDFIAEKRSLAGREKLNVRIQNLGYVDAFLFLKFNWCSIVLQLF